MKSPKHPESVNYDSLEAVTLMRTFSPPLTFVTAKGMKKVDTFNHDTYTIHTNVGTLKKYQSSCKGLHGTPKNKENVMMKRTLFTIILTLIFVQSFFLPNTFAQEHIHLNLPEGAKARLGKGTINKIAYSPDGARLAVASSIGIWMYDTKTGEVLDLLAPNTEVESVSFSPDGQILATGNEDGNVRLWHVTTGDLLQTISQFLPLGSYAGERKNVVFSPDGNTLAVSSSNNTVFLWNANTRKHLHSFIEYRYKYSNRIVPPMAFSPDGKILAISVGEYVDGDVDDVKIYVFLWDVNTGETLQTLIGHTNVSSISFSPDGSTLAIGSRDEIRFWDVSTGETLQTLTGQTGTIRSISFRPDGSTLATGSGDEIRLWDVNTRETLQTLTGHTSVSSISFSPDGSTLATGSRDEIRLWDVNTGETLQELTGHHLLYNVSFSPDGNTLAYLRSGDKDVQLRDVNTGKMQTLKLQTFTGTIYSVAFSPDGNTLAIRGRNEVLLGDINTGSLRTFTGTRRVFDPHTGVTTGFSPNVFSVAFSPDGNTLAIGGNWIISLLNTNTGETIHNFTDIACRIESVAFSPDGNTLAGGGSDGIVRLWDIKTETQRQIPTGQNGDIKVAFSPDGNTLATVPDIGGQVLLWDVNTEKQLREFTAEGSPPISRIFSMAFSPDGNTLATGSEDYLDLGTRSRWDWTVTLWDVNTGKTLQTLTGHTRTVSSISFSPDGATLATGGGGTVLLWDLTPFLPEPKKIRVDINADGIVNIQDLVLVSSHFGNTGENDADVNGDGEVNIQDLVLVADAIGGR